MDSEKVRYAVFLKEGGFAHQAFWKESRGMLISGRPTFQCSEVDLSGIHATLKVVMRDTGQAWTIWVQTQEIIAMLELDTDGKVGF